jgi:uncharacterized protein YfeS
MKLSAFFLFVLLALNSLAQNNSTKFEFSPKTAHPNAKVLMREDFFWSPIDEIAPFGSDAGSDAAYGFYKWRKEHSSTSPIIFLKELIARWNFPPIALDETDTIKIRKYISIPVQLNNDEIDQQVKMLKPYNASSANAKQKTLSDQQIRQIVINSQKNMGASFLVDLDQSIIGTAFAQFVIEGKVDPSLKHFTEKALQRELLPLLTRQYPLDAQKSHNEKCLKLLSVISKMKVS